MLITTLLLARKRRGRSRPSLRRDIGEAASHQRADAAALVALRKEPMQNIIVTARQAIYHDAVDVSRHAG